jgi:hypothetical protein
VHIQAVVEPLELLLGAVVTVEIAVTVVSARSVASVVNAAAEDVRDVEVPAELVAMESAPTTVVPELDVLRKSFSCFLTFSTTVTNNFLSSSNSNENKKGGAGKSNWGKPEDDVAGAA